MKANLMTEKSLHVFEGEDECVVAYDNDDAWQVLFEFTGNNMSDFCDKEDFATFWTMLPDDSIMKIDVEGDDRIEDVVEKTCAEWTKINDRGYLCSLNY